MPKFTIPRDATVLDVFAALDARFGDALDATEMATLLSAIRGPDDQSDELKCRFTQIIRGFLIPELCATTGMHYYESPTHVELDAARERIQTATGQPHFISHLGRALDTLFSLRQSEKPNANNG